MIRVRIVHDLHSNRSGSCMIRARFVLLFGRSAARCEQRLRAGLPLRLDGAHAGVRRDAGPGVLQRPRGDGSRPRRGEEGLQRFGGRHPPAHLPVSFPNRARFE